MSKTGDVILQFKKCGEQIKLYRWVDDDTGKVTYQLETQIDNECELSFKDWQRIYKMIEQSHECAPNGKVVA